MGFGFGAGYAGLNIGDPIAGNEPGTTFGAVTGNPLPPGPSMGGAYDILGELIRQQQDRVERIVAQNRKPKPKPKPRGRGGKGRGGAADPYGTMINQITGGGGAGSGMSAKEKQKAINEAILAARAPYDQAIVEARAGLRGALEANKRVAAEIAPTGLAGQERDQAYRMQAQAAADAMAADAAAQNDVQVASGGPAAQRAAAADDIAQSVIAAQNAGIDAQSRSQAQQGTEQATGIDHYLTAKAAETAGMLQRDTARNIARLQKERAASIAGAKSETRVALEKAQADAAAAAEEARLKQIDQAIKIMGLQQRQRQHQDSMRQRAMGDPLDALKVLAGMENKTVTQTTGYDDKGRPINTIVPAYPANPMTGAPHPSIAAVAQYFPFLQGTPYAPTPAMQTQNLGSYIGNWMQNMFGGR